MYVFCGEFGLTRLSVLTGRQNTLRSIIPPHFSEVTEAARIDVTDAPLAGQLC
jgi:hypothetical protein